MWIIWAPAALSASSITDKVEQGQVSQIFLHQQMINVSSGSASWLCVLYLQFPCKPHSIKWYYVRSEAFSMKAIIKSFSGYKSSHGALVKQMMVAEIVSTKSLTFYNKQKVARLVNWEFLHENAIIFSTEMQAFVIFIQYRNSDF